MTKSMIMNSFIILNAMLISQNTIARRSGSVSNSSHGQNYSWRNCPSEDSIDGVPVVEIIAEDFKNALLLGFSSDTPSAKLLTFPFRLIHVSALSSPSEVVGSTVAIVNSAQDVVLERVEKVTGSLLNSYRAIYKVSQNGKSRSWVFTFVRPTDPHGNFGEIGCAELEDRPYLLRARVVSED